MQTFLPLPDFKASAKALDNKRLNNQRNEVLVLAKTLMGKYPSGMVALFNYSTTV